MKTNSKQIINDLENFVIIKRVEMNARRTLSPTFQKMATEIIVDPYGASDWQCWTELLDKARKRNVNLFQDLFMIRGCGTTLTENQKYGICQIGWPYNFNPVIGHVTWPDTNTFQWYMQGFWERWGDEMYSLLVGLWRCKHDGY